MFSSRDLFVDSVEQLRGNRTPQSCGGDSYCNGTTSPPQNCGGDSYCNGTTSPPQNCGGDSYCGGTTCPPQNCGGDSYCGGTTCPPVEAEVFAYADIRSELDSLFAVS